MCIVPDVSLALNARLIDATPAGVRFAALCCGSYLAAHPAAHFHESEIVMASTYLNLHYHLVFSTKNRSPFIKDEWIAELHKYLGGAVSGLGGFPQGIGGVADHVHLLVGLKATHCLADFMRELKKSSSVWVHENRGLGEFAWQEGYSAFTVSPTVREAAQRYIAN
jgi:REP element-mobilizing transposase RayT